MALKPDDIELRQVPTNSRYFHGPRLSEVDAYENGSAFAKVQWWIAIFDEPDGTEVGEEIDVYAPSKSEASAVARAAAARDYDPLKLREVKLA